MSFEGTGDIPSEYPGDAANEGPGDGFVSQSPDEVPPTVSGSSALGHIPDVPRLDPAAETVTGEADAVPAPQAVTFGVERFAGTEPHFEGVPPAEHTEVIEEKIYTAIEGRGGVKEKYRLFRDHHQATIVVDPDKVEKTGLLKAFEERGLPVGNQPVTQTYNLDSFQLQYQAPEGTIDITVSGNDIELRTTGNDGSTSYTHYYKTWGRRKDTHEPYHVLRKDNRDPHESAPPAIEGLSQNDRNIQRLDAQLRRDTGVNRAHKAGVPDQLVSIAEATYVFDEVVANARPTPKTHDDLVRAIQAGYATRPQVTGRDLYAGAMLFEDVVERFRTDRLTPENIIDGQDATRAHLVSPLTQSITDISAGSVLDEGADRGARLPYIAIDHTTRLSGKNFVRALGQRGIVLPQVGNSGVVMDHIDIRRAGYELRCTHTVKVVDPKRLDAEPFTQTHDFSPAPAVARVLRNYLLAGDGQRARTI